MDKKYVLRAIGLLLVLVIFGLTACGGGNTIDATGVEVSPQNNDTETEIEIDAEPAAEQAEPEATLTAAEQYPDILVLHPDATNIDATPASGTYVYVVPGMVKEISDYIFEEMRALGWEDLGRPAVMGHMASANMQMGRARVAISMQDNDRSQTTRVQMLLQE